MYRLREDSANIAGEQKIVWGEGPIPAIIALVGEAPGASEEKEGRPFVGQAGKFLNKTLESVGLNRDEIYITNLVKIRTTKVANNRLSNRAPSKVEVETWKDVLFRELEIVSPKLVVCLGSLAAETLIHRGFAISRERGKWFAGTNISRIMATFHPSYVLRMKKDISKLFEMDFHRVSEEFARISGS